MRNVPAVAVPLDPLASYIYIEHDETSHSCQQASPSFAWILPLHNIIFPIIDQWSSCSNVPFYEKKKEFMALFHGWGSTASRLEPLWEGSLLFSIKVPDIAGTHFLSTSERRATQKIQKSDPKKGVSVLM